MIIKQLDETYCLFAWEDCENDKWNLCDDCGYCWGKDYDSYWDID